VLVWFLFTKKTFVDHLKKFWCHLVTTFSCASAKEKLLFQHCHEIEIIIV